MDVFENTSLMQDYVENLERRLGAYLWVDGCGKEDAYAQNLILAIKSARQKICETIFLQECHEIRIGGERE